MTKQSLIEDNIKLVYHVIKKQYPTFIGDEDIVQTGMLGLCRAADTWDEAKSKFSTYASRCIMNEIRMELRRRQKHSGVLSLDYTVNTDEGGVPFGNLIEGDSDVDFVDTSSILKHLSRTEWLVFILLREGKSPMDISVYMSIPVEQVHKHIRNIKLAWRKFNGD